MPTLPLLISGLMLLLVTPSGAVICHKCSSGSIGFTNNWYETTCNESFKSYGENRCSGAACSYALSPRGTVQSRQCTDTVFYTKMLRNCRLNTRMYDYHYYFIGDHCCYSYKTYTYAVTSCFCAKDYCNSNTSQVPTTTSLKYSQNTTIRYNSPTTAVPLNSNNTQNSSSVVTCHSCWYSGTPNNVSTNSSCEKPFTSSTGGSCSGQSCATSAYASAGYISISRICISSQLYTDYMSRCQDKVTLSGYKYFFYENQCCHFYASGSSSSTYCVCANNYCNSKSLQPVVLPPSNYTTTFSSYRSQNSTTSPTTSNSSVLLSSNTTNSYNSPTTAVPLNSNQTVAVKAVNSSMTSPSAAQQPRNNTLPSFSTK